MNALLGWVNAYALVVPNGSTVELMRSEGNGEAYLHSLDWFGREIHQAILGTSQATKEAQHESRSSKQVGQDVVGLRIADTQMRLSAILTECVSKFLVWWNDGDEAAKLAPYISLTKTEQQDVPEMLKALSGAYANGFIHHSQLQALDARLGLPPRDMEQVRAELAEKQAIAAQTAAEDQRLFQPASGG